MTRYERPPSSIDLFLCVVLSLLVAPVVLLLPSEPIRIGLGLVFVLVLPGYALVAALFPKKGDLDGIERVALSLGLSLAVVPLIGLALNYTPWGIRLHPILFTLIAFILIACGIAAYRRRLLPRAERFGLSFGFAFASWQEATPLQRIFGVVSLLCIVAAAGALWYAVALPKTGERFTEFYVLGADGRAEGYPKEVRVGQLATVVLGVVNHEYGEVAYQAEARANGKSLGRMDLGLLGHEEKWENPVSFAIQDPGENIKVEFLLYRDGEVDPYRTLHLWMNATPSATKYIVQPGDTLSTIAARFGVPMDAIVRANDIADVRFLYVGQELVIPTSASLPGGVGSPTATPTMTPTLTMTATVTGTPTVTVTLTATPSPVTYVVAAGDTSFSIAQRFGVTVEELLRLNDLQDPTRIYVGQRLLIPPTATPTVSPTLTATITVTPTITRTPTVIPTATVSPALPFATARVELLPNCGVTQIWGYIWGRADSPLPGYRVRVGATKGGWWVLSNPSDVNGRYSVTLDVDPKAGQWYVFVADERGNQLSPRVEVETTETNCQPGGTGVQIPRVDFRRR